MSAGAAGPAPNGHTARPPLLGTMWGGGFDSITPLTRLGGREQRLDLVAATEHDRRAAEDYRLLARLGLGWTREDVRWHLCEPEPGRYTFAHLEPFVRAAQAHHIRIVWSWMHYGCPGFVNPLDDRFPDQLAALGMRHLIWLREQGLAAEIVAPINELSYYTWYAASLGTWYPYAKGQDRRLKDQLIAAHRRCYERAKEVDAGTRVLLIDPFYYAIGNEADPGSLAEAAFWREAALEATDRLADRTDLVGMNFYPEGQVECFRDGRSRRYQRRALLLSDPRRLPLDGALRLYHQRLGDKPIIVTETSVRGERRGPWLRRLTDEAVWAIAAGLPLEGLCWYPVLDVPDWGYLAQPPPVPDRTLREARLAHSGLIGVERTPHGLRRTFSPTMAGVVRLQEARLLQARALQAQATPDAVDTADASPAATGLSAD
ncbi:MAG: hypothetical protein ACRDI2_00435 [Chloroflexota bacterium]